MQRQSVQSNTKIPMTALYARLSRDDKNPGESNSITNQRRILESYARSQGFNNYKFFIDDGWSGANFERPSFKEMIAGVENGEIKTIITKDLLRLGRDYLQVGMYTEIYFPQNGVRYIAINDGVDTAGTENDMTPFKSLVNEWMLRDTSKKIKAVFRSKGLSGKPITSHPVYGYVFNKDGFYVPDKETAPVVKEIYSLCLAGNGPTKIARILSERGIPTPGTIEYQRTGSTRRYHPDYPCKWATNTVAHILERKEYLGYTVNFKTEKISYKVKKYATNPEDKQAIFKNTHEPLVSKSTWNKVQKLRKNRRRPNRYGEIGLFTGMLVCADCGHILYQQRFETKTRKQDCYLCSSYKIARKRTCTAHFINTEVLKQGVMENLKAITQYAGEHEEKFVELLTAQVKAGDKELAASRKKELASAESRIKEISRIYKSLYEDNVSKKISDEKFIELSAGYEDEQKTLEVRAAELKTEMANVDKAKVNVEKFMEIVHKYMSFEELTPTLLHEFIDKIVVHEAVEEDGIRHQEIDIFYSFVGRIDLPSEGQKSRKNRSDSNR